MTTEIRAWNGSGEITQERSLQILKESQGQIVTPSTRGETNVYHISLWGTDATGHWHHQKHYGEYPTQDVVNFMFPDAVVTN